MTVAQTDRDVLQCVEHTVALVLGGGRGSRLYPLTAERAKPAVPFGGRYRLVDIPLSNCIHSGIRRMFVLTQFNSTSLNRHVTDSYRFDSFSRGFVDVLAAEQTAESGDWFQGTADAVRQHLRHIWHLGASQYLILSGDQLYRMDYRVLMETHLRASADITVAVLPVTRRNARELGIVKVASDGRIVDFVEKPTADVDAARLETPPEVLSALGADANGRQCLASMGVYVFRPEVLETILEERKNWVDFGHDVIPKSLGTPSRLRPPFNGFWEDIGTVQSYYDISVRMTQPNPPFELHVPEHPIYTRPRYLPGAVLHDAAIRDSIISEGSRISTAQISNSIIGIRTIVMPDAVIDRCVVMGADFYQDESSIPERPTIGIGAGAHISGAIIDKNASIGAGAVIRGAQGMDEREGEGFAVRDGIVIVLKNAVIPDGAVIE